MNTIPYCELGRYHSALIDISSLRDLFTAADVGGGLVTELDSDEAVAAVRAQIASDRLYDGALALLERLCLLDLAVVDRRAVEANQAVLSGFEGQRLPDLDQLIRPVEIDREVYEAAALAAQQADEAVALDSAAALQERDEAYFDRLTTDFPDIMVGLDDDDAPARRVIFLMEIARLARIELLLNPIKDALLVDLTHTLTDNLLDALKGRVKRGVLYDTGDVVGGHPLQMPPLRELFIQRAAEKKGCIYSGFQDIYRAGSTVRFRRTVATVLRLSTHGTGEALIGANELYPTLPDRVCAWAAALDSELVEGARPWTIFVCPAPGWADTLEQKLTAIDHRATRLVEPVPFVISP